MNKLLYKLYLKAKAQGRLCSRCGWIVTVKNWKKGMRMCGGCYSALQGVNVSRGHYAPRDEPSDKTGEML